MNDEDEDEYDLDSEEDEGFVEGDEEDDDEDAEDDEDEQTDKDILKSFYFVTSSPSLVVLSTRLMDCRHKSQTLQKKKRLIRLLKLAIKV